MSVVVWRGSVLAADSASYINDAWSQTRKVEKFREGVIVGCVGNWADGELFSRWLEQGADRDKPPKWSVGGKDDEADFGAITLSPDGTARFWCTKLVPEPIVGPFLAIGSGAEAATGALFADCSAQRAVQIACDVNAHCSLPVCWEEI